MHITSFLCNLIGMSTRRCSSEQPLTRSAVKKLTRSQRGGAGSPSLDFTRRLWASRKPAPLSADAPEKQTHTDCRRQHGHKPVTSFPSRWVTQVPPARMKGVFANFSQFTVMKGCVRESTKHYGPLWCEMDVIMWNDLLAHILKDISDISDLGISTLLSLANLVGFIPFQYQLN